MRASKRSLPALLIVALLGAQPALAQISDDVVKIGVLTDMSSLDTDITGAGSVAAAQLSVEDSGIGKRGYKVEIMSVAQGDCPLAKNQTAGHTAAR